MRDVTAVVLTLGEPTTERALASVRAQTLPAADVVVVEGVRPPSAALNEGAGRVRTPFFVEVDADMVLDRTCFATLRSAIGPGVAVAAAQLRDPLAGRITGVKILRTECCTELRWRDSVIQEVDLYLRLASRGWTRTCVLVPDRRPEHRHTLGEHRPDCTLEYTYATYRELGARFRYRRDLGMLARRMRLLRRGTHPLAAAARLALGHGACTYQERQVPKAPPEAEQRALLEAVRRGEARTAPADAERLLALPPEQAAHAFAGLGRSLRATGDGRVLADWLAQLARTPVERTWVAEACLGHGALGSTPNGAAASLPAEMQRGILDAETLVPTP
jgi:hypothetical protein